MDVTKDLALRKSGPQLSRKDLEDFEREIRGRLPEDYKSFLLASNGGMPVDPIGFRCDRKIREIDLFFQVRPGVQSGAVARMRRMKAEFGVDGLLPIAACLAQPGAYLDVSRNIGTVFYGVYAYEDDNVIAMAIKPLEKSFTKFLSNLVPLKKETCPIRKLGERGTAEDLNEFLGCGNSIDTVGVYGATILGEACKFGNEEMVLACLDAGANVSRTLHLAVGNHHIDLVKILVEAGADVNEPDEDGNRPLYYGVTGTGLPGERGARIRAIYDLLVSFGAVE